MIIIASKHPSLWSARYYLNPEPGLFTFGKYREGEMGFFRQQEERLAIRFLTWQYQKLDKPVPDEAELRAQAAKIVTEAHRIARERGRNVVAIIKDLVNDIKK